MNTLIGQKLKELRKEKGFSIEQICDELKISTSTYNRMENGDTNSWTSYIDKICKMYDIKPEELLLAKEKYLIISHNQKDSSVSGVVLGNVVTNLSEKIIELYQSLIKEKDKQILLLQKHNDEKEFTITLLKEDIKRIKKPTQN